jgi:hypothetical protein
MVGWCSDSTAGGLTAVRVTLLILLSAALASAAPLPGEEGTPEFQKATELVSQLGSPRFPVREAAAKKLVDLGAAAVPALAAGAKSTDEEVRTRSITLLPQARAADWRRRADAYLADKEGKQKHDLPLLADWEKITGRPDAGSRQLFADMIRTGGDLLMAAAIDPKKAPQAIETRCRNLLPQVANQGPARFGNQPEQPKVHPAELAAVLFAHSRVSSSPAQWQTNDHPGHLMGNPGIAEGIKDKEIGPAFRRVLVAWADGRPVDDYMSHQGFALSVRNNPFPEAVHALNRLASDKKAQSLNVRGVAIEALSKIADDPARKALAELINDPTVLFGGGGGGIGEFRLGDHALSNLITASGKKPSDYGMQEGITIGFATPGRQGVVTMTFRNFPTDTARKDGIQKWKAEAAKKK